MIETKFPNVYVDGEDVYSKKPSSFHKLCKWVDNTGYYQVVIRVNKKKKYIRVHRLIAETLIENPNNLPQVNHKDGNKLNNSIENLEWCTNSYNTQEGYNNNLYHSKKRSHAVKAIHKETKEEFNFKSIRECSEKLQLNRKTITVILKNNKTNNYPYDFFYN